MARTIEETRKAKRDFMAKKRAADPDAARKYSRNYHDKNREKQKKKMRDYYAKRFFWGKAMKLRGVGKATTKQLAFLWKRQRGRCALTGVRLDRTAQLDHRLPKARGGSDCIENLQWLSEIANLAKRDLTDEEFVELSEAVMRWIGRRIADVDAIMVAA